MAETTEQMKVWAGQFGQEYTDRNPQTVEDMDKLYRTSFGTTRTAMNQRFVGNLDRSVKILEIGSNVGTQLQCLQNMGFTNLYGLELQPYAVEISKSRTTGVNIIQASALDVPFRSEYFDVVFTSGVLIHISPKTIDNALTEIFRCSKKLIWGFEYFAETHIMVRYRGQDNLLWKGDFAGMFLKRYPSLRIVQAEKFKYLADDNVDAMYLLSKS
ncbi:MAG TPA: pseudaminic acid biosynthesis-associated methylase [Candidatus Hodarchaeales archaeon]|nr:pseudaminic acid biosynthesis-associated methylase [Candidatus Hodarchaeales archaeon]